MHLADINEASAQAALSEIEAAGGRGAVHALDVSDPDAVGALAAAVFAAEGHVSTW